MIRAIIQGYNDIISHAPIPNRVCCRWSSQLQFLAIVTDVKDGDDGMKTWSERGLAWWVRAVRDKYDTRRNAGAK
jgi:hypothetical protein